MLQQTQVSTVIPYFKRFMQRFPNIDVLANSNLDEVLHLWTGLGYYARARNLHRTAQIINEQFQGEFPADIDGLITLPGIGRSTAGAILALSRGQVQPILDGNVKRVLTRYHGIREWPGNKKVEERLWCLARDKAPSTHIAEYTQAIMDLGAAICTRSRPACHCCPVATDCVANIENSQLLIPAIRKKKPLPVKEALFTIIENAHGEMLLVKRPPAGIWGGLWSFPECPKQTDVSAWIESEFGSEVTYLSKYDRLRHTFSHFHLDIIPIRAKLASETQYIKDKPEYCWYGSETLVEIGLAAPVKMLLGKMMAETTQEPQQ